MPMTASSTPGVGELDGDVETGLRQIRELAADLAQVGDREQVAARDPHQRCRFHCRRARAGSSEVSSARAEPA